MVMWVMNYVNLYITECSINRVRCTGHSRCFVHFLYSKKLPPIVLVRKEQIMRLKKGEEVIVRRYQDSDAEAVANLIIRNFKEINIKDYGQDAINELVVTHDAAWFRRVASYANVYVFCKETEIVGVGAISSFWGSVTESILLTIFVLPEYHGQGIGRLIIDTLESDELYLRADRIEIPASITAVEFYRKFGYNFKNGIQELDEENHYRLEKFRA